MLVTIVVASLVSAAVAIDLAARRSRLNVQRSALLVLGYIPLLTGIFVAGGVLDGAEMAVPLCAAVLVGIGHGLGQWNYARAGLTLQAVAAFAVGASALVFISSDTTAKTVLVCAAVSILELALVAPGDLQSL